MIIYISIEAHEYKTILTLSNLKLGILQLSMNNKNVIICSNDPLRVKLTLLFKRENVKRS